MSSHASERVIATVVLPSLRRTTDPAQRQPERRRQRIVMWSRSRDLILTFVAAASALFPAAHGHAETVYANYPIGVITVGLDDKRNELRRAVSLVVSGADAQGRGAQQSTECATEALPSSPGNNESPGYLLSRRLDELEYRFNPNPDEMSREVMKSLEMTDGLRPLADVDAVRAFTAARLAEVQKQLVFASPTPEEAAGAAKEENLANHAEVLKVFKLVTERLHACNPNTLLYAGIAVYACTKKDEPCASPAVANGSMHARRYARLNTWLKSMLGENKRVPTYAILKIVPSEKDPNLAALGSTIEQFVGVVEKTAIDLKAAQIEFERLAEYARLVKKATPSYAIPIEAAEAVGIKREVAIRLADTIADIDHYEVLEADPNATLTYLQDEIARTRIRECYLLKGKWKDADLNKCLPYQLSADELYECLVPGHACVPKFKDPKDLTKNLGDISAVLITAPKELKRLIVQDVPRIKFELDDKIGEIADACKQSGLTGDSLSRCILNKYLPEELNSDRLTACVETPTSASVAIARMEKCVPESTKKLSAEARQALDTVKCIEDAAKSKTDCLLAASIAPAQVQQLLGCRDKAGQEERLTCAAGALGKDAKKVADVVQCLKDAGDDRVRIALCASKSSALSADAAKTLTCMAEKSDALAMAACAGGDKLPESVRRPVQCAASSNGNPMGAAVCMAGDGLTPDQRIALQCAAQSGGEPNTFMVCAGGQLLMKAVVSCAKTKFGESPCFGKGNELQKLIVALGLAPMGPNSVVGQLINSQIDAIKFTVSLAEDVGHQADRLAENVERELKRFDRERRRIEEQAKNNVFKTPARQLDSNIRGLGRAVRKIF